MTMKRNSDLQPIGSVIAGLKWHDEDRFCHLHGSYRARIVYVAGKKVSDGFCPKCYQLQQEALAAEQAAAKARLDAEKERKRMEEALGRACIPADFRGKSFDTFIADTPELEQALSLAKRFVSGWDKAREGGYGLYFYGNPGTGKSHLAVSIIKALLPGVSALYTRVPDMIGYIRAMWHHDSQMSSYDAVRRYVELDLLVLDELGVQAGSANEQTLLFEVIDARLSENRPTIFLSNLKPTDLVPVIGDRLVDRIKGKCVAQPFTGVSHRKPLTAEDVFGVAA